MAVGVAYKVVFSFSENVQWTPNLHGPFCRPSHPDCAVCPNKDEKHHQTQYRKSNVGLCPYSCFQKCHSHRLQGRLHSLLPSNRSMLTQLCFLLFQWSFFFVNIKICIQNIMHYIKILHNHSLISIEKNQFSIHRKL